MSDQVFNAEQVIRIKSLRANGYELNTVKTLLETEFGKLGPTQISALNEFLSEDALSTKPSLRESEASRKKVVAEKEFAVKEMKIETAFNDLVSHKANIEFMKELNVDNLPNSYVDNARDEQDRFLDGSKNRLRFICPAFDQVVPYFAGNLIVIGTTTGDGKTSTSAELINVTLLQTSKRTGNRCRVLLINNEETRGDGYTRQWHLFNRRPYSKLDALSNLEKEAISKFQDEMHASGALVIVDNGLTNAGNSTTTVEGVEAILKSVCENKNHFDLIVIDYFQKIQNSSLQPGADTTSVLTKVVNLLDDYRKKLPCALVVFAQLKPEDSQNSDFHNRIKLRKSILEVATFAAEVKRDTENYETHFKIEKNRLVQGTVGKTISLGFNRVLGRLETLTEDFKKKVIEWHKSDAAKFGEKNE
jgi:hypothetical protein